MLAEPRAHHPGRGAHAQRNSLAAGRALRREQHPPQGPAAEPGVVGGSVVPGAPNAPSLFRRRPRPLLLARPLRCLRPPRRRCRLHLPHDRSSGVSRWFAAHGRARARRSPRVLRRCEQRRVRIGRPRRDRAPKRCPMLRHDVPDLRFPSDSGALYHSRGNARPERVGSWRLMQGAQRIPNASEARQDPMLGRTIARPLCDSRRASAKGDGRRLSRTSRAHRPHRRGEAHPPRLARRGPICAHGCFAKRAPPAASITRTSSTVHDIDETGESELYLS